MRLIDADALESNGICFTVYGGAEFISLESVRTAPTIEAETVRQHGRWVDAHKGLSACKCTACGAVYETETRYCPNCGAKMDGE